MDFLYLKFKIFISKLLSFISDNVFCLLLFSFKNLPNLKFKFRKCDKSFSERLYWIKVYGDLERFSKYVDKVEVKNYVASKNLKDILVPTIAVYDSSDDFKMSELPDRFVLKLNNASGFNFIVKDKSCYSDEKFKRLISDWLKVNFYLMTRERQYKPIKNRVLAEEYIEFETGKALLDYKVYCFEGEPYMIQVISERSGFKQQHTYYDVDWNQLPISRKEYKEGKAIPKPKNLNLLVEYARVLAPLCPFCRVDFYIVNDKIFFGEITFIPANANLNFIPKSEDIKLASLINL